MVRGKTYLYGIAGAGAVQAALRPQGLPDGRAPVTVVSTGGLTAITSGYDGPPLSGLPQPELLRWVTVHQRVIEDAMACSDILPVRFGTLLDSEDEIRFCLGHWNDVVAASLARYAGLVEVEVAATWDLPRTLACVAEEPAIKAAKALAQQAPAEDLITQQVSIGQMVKGLLDSRRALYQDKLLAETGPLAAGSQANLLVADELVFNVAFLLQRCALPAFEAALDRLDEAFGGELSLRMVGPLPPYTFATVSVTRFDAARLAAGRALLGLPGEISEAAVLSSYRQLARLHHPDHNGADPAAAKRFAALNAAKSDLLAYCRSQARRGADGSALMVTVGRSASAAGDSND